MLCARADRRRKLIERSCLALSCVLLAACAGSGVSGSMESLSRNALEVDLDFDRGNRVVIVTITNRSDSVARYYNGLSVSLPASLFVRFRDANGRVISSTEFDENGFISSVVLGSTLDAGPFPLARLKSGRSTKKEIPLDRLIEGMERYSGLAESIDQDSLEAQFRFTLCVNEMLTDCGDTQSSWFKL